MDAEEGDLPLKAVSVQFRLLLRTLQRQHNVTQRHLRLVRQRLLALTAVVRQREGQHVGRAINLAVLPVQGADPLVIRKGHGHLAGVLILLMLQRCDNGASHQHFQLIGDGKPVLLIRKVNNAIYGFHGLYLLCWYRFCFCMRPDICHRLGRKVCSGVRRAFVLA